MKLFPGKNALAVLLLVARFWFASLLLYSGFHITGKDTFYMLFDTMTGSGRSLSSPNSIRYLAKIIEILLGLSLFTGLFTRASCGLLMVIMLIAIITSMAGVIDFGNSNGALTKIFFWFAGIFLVYGAGKWSLDHYLLPGKIT